MRPVTTAGNSVAASRSKSTTTQFHQTLIILFSLLFLGGSSSKELPKRVKKAVRDPHRSAPAIETARAIDSRRKQLMRDTVTWHAGFYKVLRDDESDESELFMNLHELVYQIEGAERDLLDLRFQLRGEVTAEEWKKIWK